VGQKPAAPKSHPDGRQPDDRAPRPEKAAGTGTASSASVAPPSPNVGQTTGDIAEQPASKPGEKIEDKPGSPPPCETQNQLVAKTKAAFNVSRASGMITAGWPNGRSAGSSRKKRRVGWAQA
jgi:hypothetical protein